MDRFLLKLGPIKFNQFANADNLAKDDCRVNGLPVNRVELIALITTLAS